MSDTSSDYIYNTKFVYINIFKYKLCFESIYHPFYDRK